MLFSALILSASALSPFADLVHRTSVQHEGRPVQVSYRPVANITMRQIGMAVGTRQSTERCLWNARVEIIREVTHSSGAVLTSRLDADQIMRGSHSGNCKQMKDQIAKNIDRRGKEVRTHLESVAVRDAQQLDADLYAVQMFH